MTADFTKSYWEDRYQHATTVHAPNPQLVAEAADVPPGAALDAGCGEGADALWLASRGWRVTAVDISRTALGRGRDRAEAAGVADRIDWIEADLTDWAPPAQTFGLVSSHYVHPAGSRDALFDQLAAAVAPGGTLLIVGHGPGHEHAPETSFTADEVAARLDPARWEIQVAEIRRRPPTVHRGREITLSDTVVRARRR